MQKGGAQMSEQQVDIVMKAITYIEEHLGNKCELSIVAEAIHYSKFYLHRIFKNTVGLTIHEYANRRQLTEAARLLVFTDISIIQIAIGSGYESQQAFTSIFKEMYKITPLEYREKESFYPLQLPFILKDSVSKKKYSKEDIINAKEMDIPQWMELVRLTIDGYPYLQEEQYLKELKKFIKEKRALILRDHEKLIGIMAFSYKHKRIDFIAVHPQYRKLDIIKLFVDKLTDELLVGQKIFISTFREGDKADLGQRKEYRDIGFIEDKLMTEFGYPTQLFVLPIRHKEAIDGEHT